MKRTQLSLDLRAPVRRTDPATSKEAAAQVDYGSRIYMVMVALRELGDGTSFECADWLGLPVQNISNCYSRLVRLKLAEVIGTREGPESGRARQVYQLTEPGRFLLDVIEQKVGGPETPSNQP